MAAFEILEKQGLRVVRVTLANETVRAEFGAMAYMRGAITMHAKLPSVGKWLKATLSGEAPIRPRYTGTGELLSASSVGGYHVFEVAGSLQFSRTAPTGRRRARSSSASHRERILPPSGAGKASIDYQTKVRGRGTVVLNSPGPVEEVVLEGEPLAVEGQARHRPHRGPRLSHQAPSRSILSSWISGENRVRVFEGQGKVLLAPFPYWNQRLLRAVQR